MRKPLPVLICFAVAVAAGCENRQTDLRLVTPQSPVDSEIVRDVVELIGHDSAITISLTDASLADAAALDALTSGQADIALVSNNMPYRQGISTVMPLYPTVLHIGYFGDREFESNTELIRGA